MSLERRNIIISFTEDGNPVYKSLIAHSQDEMNVKIKKFTIMWRRINKAIDMHGATPHVLRHSYLTYAVGVTTDFKTIQDISGHADVFTLVNRYAHPQDNKAIDLTNQIANILTENM